MWLDVTSDADGRGVATATVPWACRAGVRGIGRHPRRADEPVTGAAGARLACTAWRSVTTTVTAGEGAYPSDATAAPCHDVGAHDGSRRATRTVRAYDLDAAAYAEASPRPCPHSVRADLETFAARLGAGARVLEIGSGGGRDARLMEELGLRVRRTDITPGFVALLREQGHECDLLDPLVDDIATPEGPYDGVWANASLLHVERRHLATVLARLAAVDPRGGLLRISLKEGEGDAWSTHGSVRHAAALHLLACRAAARGRPGCRLDRRGGRARPRGRALGVVARGVGGASA